MSRLLFLQASLYTIIGALTPVTPALTADAPLTTRSIVCICLVSIISGATALKAFLSTTFSESSASLPDKPNARDEAAAGATPPLWQPQT